jgi:hypothetical protein
LGITAVGQSSNRFFIKSSGLGEGIGVLDFSWGKSSDENELTIPRGLDNFTWRQFSNIKFLVGVSDVTSPCDHLIVDYSNYGLDGEGIA